MMLHPPAIKIIQTNPVQTPIQKINFSLSTDQLGLILRAAQENEIIVARLLNSVFKSIVPHLSTSSQENLSPDSMRSKSYSAELRDMVIKTLQEIIASVKEF